MKIIDAHHHLWKYNPPEYGWIDDSMKALKQDFLPEDLEAEMQAANIAGTIVVQARQSLEETRWLLEMADKHPFINGVVGWIDLRSPYVVQQLRDFAGHPKLVGARHVIHDEADEDFMLRPEFKTGLVYAGAYGLCYDLLLFPRHLRRAVKLVNSLPRQRFILDHLGKPPIQKGELEPWKADINKLATYPNVWCKLSGMVTEADWNRWTPDDLKPYMEIILEAFGPDRIMIGSDWPVCTLAGAYSKVMKIVPDFIKSLNQADQARILYKNAIDCYQLNVDTNGEEKD